MVYYSILRLCWGKGPQDIQIALELSCFDMRLGFERCRV